MKKLIINCPTCEKTHNYYRSKPWSPFCSERCQLIDLGAWANEEHKIKGQKMETQTKNQMEIQHDTLS